MTHPTLKLIKCHRRSHAQRIKENLFGPAPLAGARKIGKGALKGCVMFEHKAGPKPYRIFKAGRGYVLEFVAVIRISPMDSLGGEQ